jgi:hypothetical protein
MVKMAQTALKVLIRRSKRSLQQKQTALIVIQPMPLVLRAKTAASRKSSG